MNGQPKTQIPHLKLSCIESSEKPTSCKPLRATAHPSALFLRLLLHFTLESQAPRSPRMKSNHILLRLLYRGILREEKWLPFCLVKDTHLLISLITMHLSLLSNFSRVERSYTNLESELARTRAKKCQ